MIQTKFPIIYGDRDERMGQIMIEVRPQEMTKLGQNYLVIDWDITTPDNPVAWKSKVVFYDNNKIEEVNNYLMANNDFTGMTKPEREWKKVILALMLDTQTNLLPSGKTIYRLNPENWEFSPTIFGSQIPEE